MLGMAKRKTKGSKVAADEGKGLQLNVRVVDKRLPEAIQRFARETHRSANLAMNELLEAALRSAGYWPPPDEEK